MPERGKPNAWAVARLAGVSQSAVSRAFTDGASVAPRTRARILAAASELNYRPNALARTLITNRSFMIGLVVAYLENQFYPYLIERLTEVLQEHGYQVLLFTGAKEGPSDQAVERILRYQVDGVILASAVLSSALSRSCFAAGIPVVMINRRTQDPDVSSVTSHNVEGGRLVAEFLVAGGHRRFAYVAGLEESSTSREREAGFRAGLRSAGLARLAKVRGDYSFAAATQAARGLFGRPAVPDAIFCANDHMALAVMDVARHEFGLRIPEDVSVIGYDDAGPARWTSYDLTTVGGFVDPMIATAVDILLGQIDGRTSKPVHAAIASRLLVRSSARVPAQEVVTAGHDRSWMPGPDEPV